MRTLLIVLLGILVIAGLVAWRYRHCEMECDRADIEGHRLFDRGEFLSALALIDSIDSSCKCERFTSGDAPPEYSLADACIRRLSTDGRNAEMELLLANARGPILKQLWAAEKAIKLKK